MLLLLVIGWVVTVCFLVGFSKLSSEMQQLMFLGSLGAPLMLPLTMLILTVIVLFL